MSESVWDMTDKPDWNKRVSKQHGVLEHNDWVVAMDAQERLGEQTYLVCQIDLEDNLEHIKQVGLFWDKDKAVEFATRNGAEMR